MKITVKQKHIDHGLKKDCNHCPIALAVAEKHPDAPWIYVTKTIVHIEYNPQLSKKRSKHYELPDKAQDFIHRFDLGLSVEPFSFNTKKVW